MHLISAQAQFVPTTRYTTRDGMFTERITCMTQDTKGFMWFGTYFGVMLYDGYQWQRIALPENARNKVVLCIRAVGDKVYAGIGFQGSLIEIKNGKAKSIKLPDGYTDAFAMTVHADSSLTFILGKVPGNEKIDLWNYKNDVFTLVMDVPSEYKNVSIAADKMNRLWVSTNKGAFVIDKKNIIPLIKDTAIESVSLNENGSMVLRSFGKQSTIIRYYNTHNLKPYRYLTVKDVGVYSQDENNYSGSWGLIGDQLVRIEENGNITTYKYEIPKRTIAGPIFIDREKNIWVSSEAGLYKFTNLRAQSFYFEEKGPTSTAILNVGKTKIISNAHALYELNSNKLKKILQLRDAAALFPATGQNIWIIYWSGMRGVTAATFKEHKIIIGSQLKGNFSYLKQDTKGNTWLSGAIGFTIYKNYKLQQQIPIDLPEEKNVQIINFFMDEKQQTIWAGTSHYGLLKIKYTIDEKGFYKLTVVDRIDKSKGFTDHTIRGNILKDSKERLWVGTRNSGISMIVENNGKYIIKNYSEKAGVTCSRISYIAEHKGFIWFAACDGVYQLSDAGVVRKYNTGDGLIEDYVLHIELENDTLWAGTSEGITKVLLTENKNVIPPFVALSDVRVLGVSDSSLYNHGLTKFGSSQNSIGFTFTGNTFINEKKTIYKYMLQGYDKEWGAATTVNNINYASLPAGNYTFKVHAQNAAGVWSKEPAIFRFEIVLPFYKTTWFILLVVLVLLATAYSIYAYRKSQLKKVEKLRMNIARDLHDDIGSALGSINILSKTVQRKMLGDADAENVVNKIGSTAQKTLESMDEIIWTINPGKEKTIDLVVKMQSFAQPLLESQGIEFSFADSVDKSRRLNMSLKRDLYLIFKELIYNASRHAVCSRIDAQLLNEGKFIVLQVSDNGVGISKHSLNGNRNGLVNIQSRVRNLHGEFLIDSSENSGTRCIVKVPAV